MLIEEPQDAYSAFYKDYSMLYDTCFPLKEVKIGYRNRKPWLSDSLKRLISVKNRLYRQSVQTKDDEIRSIYKKLRNKVNKLLLKEEKDYYDKILNENKDNI